MKSGKLTLKDEVSAEIDSKERKRIKSNHSGTHLLHAALREVLGDHVEQKGSLVDQSKLRFDFTHSKSIETEEIAKIENLINEQILLNSETITEILPIEELLRGALLLFLEISTATR